MIRNLTSMTTIPNPPRRPKIAKRPRRRRRMTFSILMISTPNPTNFPSSTPNPPKISITIPALKTTNLLKIYTMTMKKSMRRSRM